MTTEPARRAGAVDDELMTLYPDAACALDHDGPFQLLVATVLSAQTTDARVNTVTPELFEHYPDPAALGAARREDLEAILRPLGFQRAKAGHLLGIGQALTERFEGRVPRSREELVALPGVGGARPPTSCSATPSGSPPSPWTPTWGGSRAAWGGRRRRTRCAWRRTSLPCGSHGAGPTAATGSSSTGARSARPVHPAAVSARCSRPACAHRWASDGQLRAVLAEAARLGMSG